MERKLGLLCFLTFCFCAHLVSAKSTTLSQNVFNDIVVAVSPSALTNDQTISVLTTRIQSLMTATSNALYTATGNRLSFGVVTIVFQSQTSNLQRSRKPRSINTDPSSFETADIRVDIPNVAYGDLPYAQQSGFCGEQGDFIHITSNFVAGGLSLTYGAPEKLLAKEWVKYFFGVYDEQGYSYSNLYPVKYFASGAQSEYTICSNTTVQFSTETCSGGGPVLGIPDECNLQVDPVTTPYVNSSMMALSIVPVTDHFCSDDDHNSDAPTKQNVMCNGKSIMNITLSHAEVVDSKPATSLTFYSIVNTPDNSSLALAVLWGNMEKTRSKNSAQPSLDKFIMYDFPQDAYLTYVQTLNYAPITWNKFDSAFDRATFVQGLNPTTSNNTNDPTEALNAIVSSLSTNANIVNKTKVILMISAGNQTQSAWTSVCNAASGGDFQLYLLSFSPSEVNNFQLTDVCFGDAVTIQAPKSPYGNDVWASELQQCYGYLQERKQMDDYLRAFPNKIAPSLYGPPQSYFEEVYFNSTSNSFDMVLTTSTTTMTNRFYYESCESLVNTEVSEFLSCVVNNGSQPCVGTNTDTQAYCAEYNVNITNTVFNCTLSPLDYSGKKEYPPYVVYSVGQPSTALVDTVNPPVTLNSWVVAETPEGMNYLRVRIFGRLVRGTTPIFDAKVVATITSSMNETYVTLRDDGSGNPDVAIQDGIYSAYFTQFDSSTSYSILVTATDNSIAVYPTKQYTWITTGSNLDTLTGTFSRTSFAGTFSTSQSVTLPSAIPPGRILDLQVQSSDSSSVTLAWTAPGADLDYGTVDEYYFKCSSNKDDLNTTNFQGINDNQLGISAVQGGNRQTYTIHGSVDGVTHYCAIYAYDSISASAPSNIISYTIIQNGLTSGQIAGISIGVIIAIVVIVLISVLIFFMCFKKEKKITNSNLNATTIDIDKKLDPISVEAVPLDAIHQPGYGVENESAQRHSRPASAISRSSFDSVDSDNNSKLGKNHMLTFQTQNSRSPSPRPVPIPKIPELPLINAINVIDLGAPPSHQVILNARPLQAVYERPDNSGVFIVNNPDVARPVRLTQMATIEDTGDYQDTGIYKPDIPVYNHLLNKQPMFPPPKRPIENESEDSSSSSSSSSRSTKHNTQV